MRGLRRKLASSATVRSARRALRAKDGAVEKTRTSKGFPPQHLKLARLPIPPRPHGQRRIRAPLPIAADISKSGRGIASETKSHLGNGHGRDHQRYRMAHQRRARALSGGRAAMEARVAAIRAGTRARAGLAAGASAALHRRHQRPAGRPRRARPLPGYPHRPRRAIHLSRPRPARRLRDARLAAARRRRPRLCPRSRGMADPHAGALQRDGRAARRARRHLDRRRRRAARARSRRSACACATG